MLYDICRAYLSRAGGRVSNTHILNRIAPNIIIRRYFTLNYSIYMCPEYLYVCSHRVMPLMTVTGQRVCSSDSSQLFFSFDLQFVRGARCPRVSEIFPHRLILPFLSNICPTPIY